MLCKLQLKFGIGRRKDTKYPCFQEHWREMQTGNTDKTLKTVMRPHETRG